MTDLCGEALTRAGPPAQPDVFRLRPLKLLMKLLQHWRLRTNKHRLARLTLEQQTLTWDLRYFISSESEKSSTRA